MQNFSSSSNFFGYGILFNSPTPLAPAVGSLRSPPAGAVRRAQSLCHVYYDEFFGSPQKNFANERGFDFLDGQTEDRQTDGQTDRNFVEILGKLCFARLKLNLKTEDRFKLKTKLGFFFG